MSKMDQQQLAMFDELVQIARLVQECNCPYKERAKELVERAEAIK